MSAEEDRRIAKEMRDHEQWMVKLRQTVTWDLDNAKRNTEESEFTKGTSKEIAADMMAYCADFDGSDASYLFFDPDNADHVTYLEQCVEEWLVTNHASA